MTNLRDPVRRTELCLSCHLGDIACGKFVTHDMFAAGHPPLPAFEVESFLEQMPPHWRPAASARPIPPLLSRTRSVAFEGLVTLRASVRLLADADRLPKGHAGDFAIYDCTACHHELQIPSPRQERGYFGGAPGRPPMRGWNIPLAVAAIESQSSKDGTTSPSQTRRRSCNRQPAADPSATLKPCKLRLATPSSNWTKRSRASKARRSAARRLGFLRSEFVGRAPKCRWITNPLGS